MVVADELFMMSDERLSQKARYSCPNTFMESKQGARLMQRQQVGIIEQSSLSTHKLREDWQHNMYAVQAHAFNNVMEPVDSSVYDYLLKFSHDIISFKMFDRLVDYWNTNKIEWHLDRGLKLNTDGSPISNPNARVVNSQLLQAMNKYQKQSFIHEARQGVFGVSCIKPGQLTAHMSSSGASTNSKTYAHECHYF